MEKQEGEQGKASVTAIPFYGFIVLPGASFYFQKEYFEEIAGKSAVAGETLVFLMLREERERKQIKAEDLYPIGVRGVVTSVGEEGEVGVKAEQRVDLLILDVKDGEIRLQMKDRPEEADVPEEELRTRFETMKLAYLHFLSDSHWGQLAAGFMGQWNTMSDMISAISGRLPIPVQEKYAILAADKASLRVDLMEKAAYELLEQAKVSTEAEKKQSAENEKRYREDAIRRQIDYLQGALDEMHPENENDIRRFEKKIAESGMNETAMAEANKVLGRLRQENRNSSEYGLLYDYLEFVTTLKWIPEPQKKIDLEEAKTILEEDHYGMNKVKARILEQLAVMALKQEVSGAILLFVGAPGTGKTSIGAGIARALGRKYVRVSLGGVHDEAEIRGHRRTYIGAMAGRVMDGIHKCGSASPVMVLDEVDKLTKDYGRDPASALLEVLDPEQNSNFTDHYMNVPYDLSNTLFICTANTTETIPQPLLDRMEIIRFDGYTATEKLEIARRHLIPAALAVTGLKAGQVRITDEAIKTMITGYTAESGVRALKRCLNSVCRSAAVQLVRGEKKSLTVSGKRLRSLLDEKPIRHDDAMKTAIPGVVTGLAWTAAGGEILFIEAVFTQGSGKLLLTGKLGDVMKESAELAVTYVKSQFPQIAGMFEKNDLHIHVPEGAVPKDGPSAGVTMACAVASALTGIFADPSVAMTGELSLRGIVLPIGGLTEKLMAAQRAGIKTVLIPEGNKEDLEDVPKEVRDCLRIRLIRTCKEAMELCGIQTEDNEDQNSHCIR